MNIIKFFTPQTPIDKRILCIPQFFGFPFLLSIVCNVFLVSSSMTFYQLTSITGLFFCFNFTCSCILLYLQRRKFYTAEYYYVVLLRVVNGLCAFIPLFVVFFIFIYNLPLLEFQVLIMEIHLLIAFVISVILFVDFITTESKIFPMYFKTNANGQINVTSITAETNCSPLQLQMSYICGSIFILYAVLAIIIAKMYYQNFGYIYLISLFMLGWILALQRIVRSAYVLLNVLPRVEREKGSPVLVDPYVI